MGLGYRGGIGTKLFRFTPIDSIEEFNLFSISYLRRFYVCS